MIIVPLTFCLLGDSANTELMEVAEALKNADATPDHIIKTLTTPSARTGVSYFIAQGPFKIQVVYKQTDFRVIALGLVPLINEFPGGSF